MSSCGVWDDLEVLLIANKVYGDHCILVGLGLIDLSTDMLYRNSAVFIHMCSNNSDDTALFSIPSEKRNTLVPIILLNILSRLCVRVTAGKCLDRYFYSD